MTKERASTIALSGLAYIAADQDCLDRFVAISGVRGTEIRSRVNEPAFLAGVLSFLLTDDGLLISIGETHGINPQEIRQALRVLDGPGCDG